MCNSAKNDLILIKAIDYEYFEGDGYYNEIEKRPYSNDFYNIDLDINGVNQTLTISKDYNKWSMAPDDNRLAFDDLCENVGVEPDGYESEQLWQKMIQHADKSLKLIRKIEKAKKELIELETEHSSQQQNTAEQ